MGIMGLSGDNGKVNGNYIELVVSLNRADPKIRGTFIMENQMEKKMENEMETGFI